MNAPLFHATCLAAIESEFGWVVGLADHEFNTTRYLQFQNGHVSDSQDQAPGQDMYYVERDDQSNSCHGGIESIDLNTNMITLKFSDAGSRALKLEKIVRITFEADARTLERFKSGLAAVFAGTGLVGDWANE